MKNIMQNYKYSLLFLIGFMCFIFPFRAFAFDFDISCDFCDGLKDWIVDTATEAAAKALGIDTEDNCTVPQAENGYCVYTDEQKLACEITRLQKEGWHIGKVYENCKYDKI